MIAEQLNQDMSRGWMVVHAKFQKISQKISQNISIVTLIRNFWVVWVVGQSETSQSPIMLPYKKTSQLVNPFTRYDLSNFW